jgi:hypothetical protein
MQALCTSLGWYEQSAVNAVRELLGVKHRDERIKEIETIIKRLDSRWDMGCLKQEGYVEKREEPKTQLARLQPIPQDELIEEHRMLKEFPTRWGEADVEGRQRLLNLMLTCMGVRRSRLRTMTRPSAKPRVS